MLNIFLTIYKPGNISYLGGGQVVSVLAFYSDDPSSNPAESFSFFCIFSKGTKIEEKRPRLAPPKQMLSYSCPSEVPSYGIRGIQRGLHFQRRCRPGEQIWRSWSSSRTGSSGSLGASERELLPLEAGGSKMIKLKILNEIICVTLS